MNSILQKIISAVNIQFAQYKTANWRSYEAKALYYFPIISPSWISPTRITSHKRCQYNKERKIRHSLPQQCRKLLQGCVRNSRENESSYKRRKGFSQPQLRRLLSRLDRPHLRGWPSTTPFSPSCSSPSQRNRQSGFSRWTFFLDNFHPFNPQLHKKDNHLETRSWRFRQERELRNRETGIVEDQRRRWGRSRRERK